MRDVGGQHAQGLVVPLRPVEPIVGARFAIREQGEQLHPFRAAKRGHFHVVGHRKRCHAYLPQLGMKIELRVGRIEREVHVRVHRHRQFDIGVRPAADLRDFALHRKLADRRLGDPEAIGDAGQPVFDFEQGNGGEDA